MQILSKHITQSGGLEIIFISNGYEVHMEEFPPKEVLYHMFTTGAIEDYGDGRVKVTGDDWVDYIDFLQAQLSDNTFCEKILSTNTIIK